MGLQQLVTIGFCRSLRRVKVASFQGPLDAVLNNELSPFNKRLDHLVLGNHCDVGSTDKEVTAFVSCSYADVGVACLARTIHDAAHHGHLKGNLSIPKGSLCLFSDRNHINLGASAGGTCDQVDVLPFAKTKCLEKLTTSADTMMLSGPTAMKPRWPMPAMAPSSSTALMT